MAEAGFDGNLASFLEAHRQEILVEWEGALLPRESGVLGVRSASTDELATLLERIVQIAGEQAGGRTQALPFEAAPLPQLTSSSNLVEVVTELASLRECIVRLLLRSAGDARLAQVWLLNRALDRALLAMVEAHDRQELATRTRAEAGREPGAERMRLLDQASRLLTESLELEATLAHVAHLAVPRVADFCLVELVERGQGLRMAALAHRDPDKERMARQIHVRYPPDPNTTGGLWSVVRSGEARLHSDVHEEDLAAAAQDECHLELLRSLGLCSLMLVPLAARSGVIGVVAFAAAESGRRYGPDDLAFARELASRAAFALDNARLYEQAQRETRARENLLAIVSHDLKNPLSAIHLATTILKQRATQQEDTRAARHLDAIERATMRMARLIADLLDMASIQAGRLSIERKPHDAALLVRDALEQHQALAEENSIVLMRQGEPAAARVLCDRERILQVFANLIGNALKFCRPGESVTLLCETRGADVQFSVVDTGPGIPCEDLGRIFEPYWTSRGHHRRGTGLGLFISKGIIETHGGKIWVESRVGLGTSFMFVLPRA